jgi:hypothetical protein
MAKLPRTDRRAGIRCLLAAAAIHLLSSCLSPARAGDVLDWANKVMTSCWSCGTLNQIMNVGLNLAEQAFTALASQTANLLGLLMAIWILFFAAKMFLPFGLEGDASSLWNRGAKKLLQFAVVLAFLQSSQSFWNYIFIPMMSAGMQISNTIVTLSNPYEAANGTSETGPSGSASNPNCSAGTDGQGVTGAMAVMAQMNCPLATVQSQFAKGMFVGIAQIYGSAAHSSDVRYVCSVVGGLVQIGVFFFGMVLYPIFMIEVIMRVTIVTVLAPVALAASMFEPTRRISEKAAWQIGQAALTLVFVSIVAGIAKATLAYVFSNLTVDGAPAGATDWASLITMLENQKTAGNQDFHIDLTTMAFYELLGVGVIMLFMLRQAPRMAAEFTGASGGDFSGALAGVAALAGAAVTAQKVTGLALRTAGGGTPSDLASKVARPAGSDRTEGAGDLDNEQG